jgi:membrane-bound ClpP family serine protease
VFALIEGKTVSNKNMEQKLDISFFINCYKIPFVFFIRFLAAFLLYNYSKTYNSTNSWSFYVYILMILFNKSNYWKIILMILGAGILVATILYSNFLAMKLRENEEKNINIYIDAISELCQTRYYRLMM